MTVIHRPARIVEPLTPPEPHTLANPPQLGDAPTGGIPIQTLLPVIGSLSSITMIVVLRANPLMVGVGAVILLVALLSAVGMTFTQRANAARTRRRARERYLDYLEQQRTHTRDLHNTARTTALAVYPAPNRLMHLARNPERLWERRRRDADALSVRIGSGAVPWLAMHLPAAPDPVNPFDPLMAAAAQRVCDAASTIPGFPAWVSLRSQTTVSVVGAPDLTDGVVRSMLAHLAVFHSPRDLQVGAVIPPARRAQWAGIDGLPHLRMDAWDGPVLARRIAPDMATLGELIAAETAARAQRAIARSHLPAQAGNTEVPLILLVDATALPAGRFPLPVGIESLAQLGITVITMVKDRIDEPEDTSLRITVQQDPATGRVTARVDHTPGAGNGGLSAGSSASTPPALPETLTPDLMDSRVFAALTGELAGLSLSAATSRDTATTATPDALDSLGITDLKDVSPRRWHQQPAGSFLQAPFGITDNGDTVTLDLRESAHGGMGPHGICIGATGSGKSEFLRTLILSLAARHSPDDLAMILMDYKGGAAFTPFARLPHVAGIIDNLADDQQLIARAKASIEGEIVRRQRLLKEAGSHASITDYRAARATNPALAPLPHLFLVIDEFGELLTAEPEFISVLLQIGRIGRALGIHLLLASQRLESGRLRGLESYLSYRIALRTFSAQESTMILETPDAHYLPPIPGVGYLKVDTTTYVQFTAAYVSGPVPATTARTLDTADDTWGVLAEPPYNTIEVDRADIEQRPVQPVAASSGRRIIDEVVTRLTTDILATTPVWLPPLADRIPLISVLDDHPRTHLSIPVGIEDIPSRQTQQPWMLDLTAAGGHHAIIGAPHSGRTTFLRTLAAGIATTHTPRDIAVYGLDLAGAGLARLEAFPHVGSIATRSMREEQHRLLDELRQLITDRERLSKKHGIESLHEFRTRHARGELGDGAADVVLLIDGYALVRTEFDSLADPIADILARGSSHGVHVVMALTRWNDLPMRLQPLIGTRAELRLNDASESTIGRKLSELIRSDQPGRALTHDGNTAQVALPVVDDLGDDNLGEALATLAAQVSASWNGPSASPIRLLPDTLDPATLPTAEETPVQVPLGLRQDTMTPELLDLDNGDQHLLILGDSRSGKTTAVRHIMAALMERHTPEELVFAVVETRGDLGTNCPEEYLGGHANSLIKAEQLAAALATELEKRLTHDAPATMRVVFIIDDLDIIAAGGRNPLTQLLPFLPSARNIRFHVIVTRPVAGASRALYDSGLQMLRDTGGTGIVLSGDRSEGPLWPGVYASNAIPGRATIVRRGQSPRLIHVANREALVSTPVG
ncbi:type VII secretion protein EccC [Jonesia quinghaiensis]|uniref:type VII secretion protein EccC n=1 Tax=Jonesia quinghaiensis TaxID=262806 RepID=UPI000426283A|nr:type VII secretion protein EccC [Jonesia quinghaiensis]